MIRGTKYIQIGIAALVALAFSVSASAANYNSRYGPVLWKDLPLRGSVSKVIWVGSWWPYTKNGVAWRHRGDSIPSPAELFDEFMGNKDKIDLDLAKTYYEMVEKDLSPKQKRIQELVPTLNRMIERGETWQDTDEGKEYTTLRTEIDEAKKNLPTVPTESATMWEIIHSGRGVIGVGGWWGHCNAWSAAAIMDLEPRKNAVVNGVTFTPGDIKALLTEAWMEQSSSFFGTRNEYHGDEEARSKIDFRDVTPAAFHIFITDQIGNKDKSFVIDRFTGSEVWNQPMKAYRVTEVKKLYTDDTAVEKDLIVTEYDQWTGKATESTLQKQNVFPIQVTTTFHWVTDGLPPETLTADQDLTEVPDDGFSDSYTVSRLTDDQIDVRTLTYTLYLTKPLEDPAAEVVGDGDWNHQDTWGDGYNHTHPDFMWQPLANTPSRRDYENPHIGANYQKIVDEILSLAIEKPEPNQPTSATRFELSGSWEIKDNRPDEPTVIDVVVDTVAKVSKVTICVDVEHTYVGDLQGTLIDPSGAKRVFKKYRVYGSQKNLSNKCWNVAGFDGHDTNGTWKIEWRDNAGQDSGRVTRILMRVNDPEDTN